MKRRTIDLSALNFVVTDNQTIQMTKDKEIQANTITVIKRDGSIEPYMPEKMYKVVLWACSGNHNLAQELLKDTEIKIYDKIKISDLFEELIKTAVNKISLLYPIWENVSAKFFILKLYKESYGDIEYPHFHDVVKKGVSSKIYGKESFSTYTDEDYAEIDSFIDQTRDFLFNYKGLYFMNDKYCLNLSKNKKLELPQISYMRVATFLMHQEKYDRNNWVKRLYDQISNHNFTLASPIMLNSGTLNPQLSSCVLNKTDDDSHSITGTGQNLAIYSKFKGGTALDITSLRAKGSYIEGNQGRSSGPVPFIQFYERIMKAWNQGSTRPGACAIYFQWWHLDVQDLIVLKSNGGTDENRARGLKYAIKLNNLFLNRIESDEEISLFDPLDTPDLIGLYGEEFEKRYVEYENKVGIRRTKLKARDLWFKIMKERTETGNLYMFHEENVNERSQTNRYINSSNLCTEILQPSEASKLKEESIYKNESGEYVIKKEYKAGEIALCNLASVNLYNYYYMTEEEKDESICVLMRAMDNSIDVARYPVKEGKHSNMMNRYVGIGVLNKANLLASLGIDFDSQEALEKTHEIMDELAYRITKWSMNLAKERGSFRTFKDTKWAKGHVPVMDANKEALKLTKYQPDMEKWKTLGQEIAIYGLRNALLMAIAPTATSGKAVNATESIEPVQNFFYKEDGTVTIPTLAPNFKQNGAYYKKAFDCDQLMLIKHAAIHQIYLDQSQSVNVYFKRPDSLLELSTIHYYGFKLGLKTFYYVKSMKAGEEEICESCS